MTLLPNQGLSAALQSMNGVTRLRLLNNIKGVNLQRVNGRGCGAGERGWPGPSAPTHKSCQRALPCRGDHFWQLAIKRHPSPLQLSPSAGASVPLLWPPGRNPLLRRLPAARWCL